MHEPGLATSQSGQQNADGLGFFDEEHNVTGAAPNDIELHPVVYIKFR